MLVGFDEMAFERKVAVDRRRFGKNVVAGVTGLRGFASSLGRVLGVSAKNVEPLLKIGDSSTGRQIGI